ncbi:MAG TPA: hypothetical protein VMU28_07780 [Terriglobales bacterium]|nr:hypothetical protein [Terriglobales bacterium]
MVNLAKNPEFVRHVRAEMRAPRMLLSGGLALLICFLMQQGHSQWVAAVYPTNRPDPLPVAQTLYFWILCVIAVTLPLWCLSSCLQAIAAERQMKTYDFVRTTRLTALELLLGYIFGTPIMAYYTVGLAAVVAFCAGLKEHVPVSAMLVTYLMLWVLAIFASLLGLLISLVVEKPRAAGLLFVLLFFCWPMGALAVAAGKSPFPGISALGVITGLLPFYGTHDPSLPSSAPFFGIQVPLILVSLFLYVTLGAWIVMALLNNLKKEREEIRLFTNRQALAFSVYMNVLLVGFFDTTAVRARFLFEEAVGVFLALNLMAFYVTGLVTLTSAERLKSWYREYKAGRQGYLSNNGLPWPWIFIAGFIAYDGFAAITLLASNSRSPNIGFGTAAFATLLLLVFAIRDILFLQWCMLTRMKNPVSKGVGLLFLYYIAVVLLSSVFGRHDYGGKVPAGLAIFTPAAVFNQGKIQGDAVFGLVLQSLVILVLLVLINERLASRPKAMAAAAASS